MSGSGLGRDRKADSRDRSVHKKKFGRWKAVDLFVSMRGGRESHQPSGDHRVAEPPGPIPNPDVKRCSADGSWMLDSARVGRRQLFARLLRKKEPGSFFCGCVAAADSAWWPGEKVKSTGRRRFGLLPMELPDKMKSSAAFNASGTLLIDGSSAESVGRERLSYEMEWAV